MNKVRRALIRSRLLAMTGYFKKTFGVTGKKKAKTTLAMVGIAVLAVYLMVYFFVLFYLLFSKLCEPFHMIGIDWLYFCMAGMMAMVLMFIGSIFMTQAQLFEAKDNELLLAMPIRPSDILFSRMMVLYVYNLVFGLLVLIPAGYAYMECAGVRIVSLIFYMVLALLLPFFSIALASLIGWMLALVGSGVRNKSLFTMIFSLAFLALYFWGYTKVFGYIQTLILNGAIFAEKIKSAALPLYYLGNSVAKGDLWQLLVTALCLTLPFVLLYVLLSKFFIKITTTRRGFAKIEYREQAMKRGSRKAALLKKELRAFVASPVYMMNGSLGVILLVVSAVAIIIKKDDFMQYIGMLPAVETQMMVLLPMIVCMMSSTNIITAPAISLEGKSLWVLRSMPIPTREILMAKVQLQLYICVPAVLLASICYGIAFGMDVIGMFFLIVLPVIANIMFALLGLVINLKLPKLDAISEAAAVKQSASTIVDMLAAMALVMIPGALYIVNVMELDGAIGAELFLGVVTVVYTLISLALYRYLCTKGCRIFESL